MSLKRVFALLLIPYALWLAFAYQYHFIDGANLLFHEGGHFFFRYFGEVLAILGGTIGQFVFPIACIVYFLREQKQYESSICGLWLGESMMYMAAYMKDAQVQSLPLFGSGHRIHDWNWLLTNAGLIKSSDTLAALFHGIASIIVIGSVYLAIRYSATLDTTN